MKETTKIRETGLKVPQNISINISILMIFGGLSDILGSAEFYFQICWGYGLLSSAEPPVKNMGNTPLGNFHPGETR